MLTDGQRREALGVALLGVGILVTLSVTSPLFLEPGRNLIGPAGRFLARGAWGAFGTAGIVVAIPAVLLGLYYLGALTGARTLRWSILMVGGALFLPPAFWLLGGRFERVPNGWLGQAAGESLAAGFGRVGAILIVIAAIIVLLVLTLGWSPGRAARRGGVVARKGIEAGTEGAVALGRAVADLYRVEPGTDPDGLWADPPEDVAEAEEATAPPSKQRKKRGRSRDASPAAAAPDEPTPFLAEAGNPELDARPPVDLLTAPRDGGGGLRTRDLEELGDVLVQKLATFRIAGEIGGWTTGPVVTQFEVVPAPGVKVGQIAARADDIALALRAPSIRIVAPIPGKGAVGVEVPNPSPRIVYLREVLESPAYRRSRAGLPLALGRDLEGKPYCGDLARMPHLLIAGATGSGKSVCMNTLITSLVYRYSPAQLRLLMVDPKMVELSVYGDLPHLRHPVITDNDDAATVLKWAVYEMKRRFRLLSSNASRNLGEFNRRVRSGRALVSERTTAGGDPHPYDDGELPYIVLMIDELADLMMTVQSEIETPLAMLAQKARAVGLHLVVATQRPSVNVLTGLIKANFPSRIAFRVASKIDSRTILDQNGAEALLGNGDMLFLPPGAADPVRVQGAFISSAETEALLDWYRAQAESEAAEEPDILEEVREREEEENRIDVTGQVLEDRDDLFRQAAEIVVSNSSGSTSLLQRRLKIGYGRAARIIDQLHHAGVVGPADGSKPREILVSLSELETLLGP